jgi:integrase
MTAFREIRRQRPLSSDELQRLGDTLRKAETQGLPWNVDESKYSAKHLAKPEKRHVVFSPYVIAAVRLLLFTGCRLREILHLRWSEVDIERGMLWLSDSKTGPRAVVLNAPALDVLNGLERIGTYVIAGDNFNKPRSDLKRPWDRIKAHAQLQGVRLHDLRHSFGSIGAGRGLGLPIIGKLLGHASPVTTARYVHLDNDPLRRASERIGSVIVAGLGDPARKNASAIRPLGGGPLGAKF